MNAGFGPLTALYAARRARATTAKESPPWDEMRVIFTIDTDKSRDEYANAVNKVANWPTGWKLTIISGRPGRAAMHVYFSVDSPPQYAAGAFVRATLSLVA